MRRLLTLFVPFLMGAQQCSSSGGGSGFGGGGSSSGPPPNDTSDTGSRGGTSGTLTNCDPEYDAIWVRCDGSSNWVFHAEMNVAITSINVAFTGTSEGNTITEQKSGVFEGDLSSPTHDCTEANTFDFRAFGTMLSTYECSYDYVPN